MRKNKASAEASSDELKKSSRSIEEVLAKAQEFVDGFDPDRLLVPKDKQQPRLPREVSRNELASFHLFYESKDGLITTFEDEDGHLVTVRSDRLV